MLEARSMQLSKDQMPDLYALWVDRRAAMGRGIQGLLLWMGQAQQMTSLAGPPTKKELNVVWQEAIARGEIKMSDK